MSLTRTAWRSQRCPAGKIRHRSSTEAEIARARMVAIGAASPGELKIYRCDLCKNFIWAMNDEKNRELDIDD
jgi:hypothetical protein